MSDHRFMVRKAAVLGAGVMGAQIAAHLVNANIETLLFELPAEAENPNANVTKAIERLKKLEPSPLSVISKSTFIHPANYDQHLGSLTDCDLVIEAIAERVDWKTELYAKIIPYLAPHTLVASNTSGLSINQLAAALPEELQHRFCGIHFFNPPRYMHLIELIPCTYSDQTTLDHLESFLTTYLGKGVIRAKDTPNFIANRVGVFSMLATIHHASAMGLSFDLVDQLTGTLIGRPKSATFRTADVVGLDVLSHVVETMRHSLAQDPWHSYYVLPGWLQQLITQGALGQKSSRGVYQKKNKDILVFNPAKNEYENSTATIDEDIQQLLKQKDPARKFSELRENPHPQAQFLWAIHRDLFHYCAVHLAEIANNARDLDLAVRWGFGWTLGPFEIWQAAGWVPITKWINEDIAAGRAMSQTPLPDWVMELGKTAPPGVHGTMGSFAPLTKGYQPRSTLSVYRRQPFPDRLIGEEHRYGETIFENNAVRMWHTGDD
ncbi:MAG TPA: 3-hydroxyacyl-CoA dehydrogenase family protein, partial [Nitrosomonas sp.]|nr:3-hydroxyacyl-CoA dehydrogenase family protein [Nitrosomonas sp.]